MSSRDETRIVVYNMLKASSRGLTENEIDSRLGRYCYHSIKFLVQHGHAVVDRIEGEGRSRRSVYKATDVAPHKFRIISRFFAPDEARLKSFFGKSAADIAKENNVSKGAAATYRDIAHLLANENLNGEQRDLVTEAVRLTGFGQVSRAREVIRPLMNMILGGRSSPKGRTHQQKQLHDKFARTLNVLMTICDNLSSVPIPTMSVEDRADLSLSLQAACKNIHKFRTRIGEHHV